MKIVLTLAVITIFISGCSKPKEATENKDTIILEQGNSLVLDKDSIRRAENKTIHKEPNDEYSRYSKIMNARFNKNQENLEKMKRNFTTEDSRQRIKYQQEIFDLNKKNVQIKSKAMDRANHNFNTWEFFKTSTNEEMKELEDSIQMLSEKTAQFLNES